MDDVVSKYINYLKMTHYWWYVVKNIQYGIYDRSVAYLGGPLGITPFGKKKFHFEKMWKLGSPLLCVSK